MTYTTDAPKKYVAGASRGPRSESTLRLHLLMEEQQRLEIGERIAQLRDRSPRKSDDDHATEHTRRI